MPLRPMLRDVRRYGDGDRGRDGRPTVGIGDEAMKRARKMQTSTRKTRTPGQRCPTPNDGILYRLGQDPAQDTASIEIGAPDIVDSREVRHTTFPKSSALSTIPKTPSNGPRRCGTATFGFDRCCSIHYRSTMRVRLATAPFRSDASPHRNSRPDFASR